MRTNFVFACLCLVALSVPASAGPATTAVEVTSNHVAARTNCELDRPQEAPFQLLLRGQAVAISFSSLEDACGPTTDAQSLTFDQTVSAASLLDAHMAGYAADVLGACQASVCSVPVMVRHAVVQPSDASYAATSTFVEDAREAGCVALVGHESCDPFAS